MDPFATLGLAARYDLDPAELESHYRELQRALHPDKHTSATASARRMALSKAVEVNDAYRVLRDDVKRAEALFSVVRDKFGSQLGLADRADPELLMEVMELRETLSDAKQAGNMSEVQRLAEKVDRMRQGVDAKLRASFSDIQASATDPSRLQALALLISRLKYYRRFLDEVIAIEEEHQG